jgi:T5orf172 domain
MSEPAPNRKPRRVQRRVKKRRRLGPTPLWTAADYVAWIYVMRCEDHPDLVKVGLSGDPVRRAFEVREKGAILPIVEYGRQAPNAADIERRAHESLRYCRAHGEWFRCSVAVATTAIIYASGTQNGTSRGREEWIEDQAQAVAKDWSGDWQVPVAMLPRVQQLRAEAQQRAKKAAISFAVLLAALIAGVLALLLVPWSTLASWALIAVLVAVGIFAVWYLLWFIESQWKARRKMRIFGLPALACGLGAYLEGTYQWVPRAPFGVWLVLALSFLGLTFGLLAIEDD